MGTYTAKIHINIHICKYTLNSCCLKARGRSEIWIKDIGDIGGLKKSGDELEADDREDEGRYEEDAPEGGGFVEEEYADKHCADGADAGPDGINGTDR